MSTDYVNALWKSESRLHDDNKLLSPHLEEYARLSRACVEKMSRFWNEIEYSTDERRRELEDISHSVKQVWHAAINRAEKKKEECQQRIDQTVQEIFKIKEELGESPIDNHRQGIEGVLKLERIVGCSLQARLSAVQEVLMEWKLQRQRREMEFKSLQSQINNLKIRFGDVVIAASMDPCKADISLENLNKLAEELEACKAEKSRRERELATLLSKLRSVCLQIGENDIDIAATVHPSLRFYREALPDQFSLVRPSFSNQPGLQRNIRPEDIELDLSNETFRNLESKIEDVFNWKANREKQTSEVAEVLRNLWTALDIPEDDLERGIHVRALEGPTKLHLQSIEKCRNEVGRLETAKAKQLWDLINMKQAELEQLCEETKLPMPHLSSLLTINGDNDDDGSPVGKISDALSKLTKMIAETQSLVEKRQPLLSQIIEIERSRAEVAWLSEYEKDGDRYKGRDSTKKLNRALRAGRMRDKLPDMINILRKAMIDWEQDERRPFVYDNQDYNVVLDNLEIELTAVRQPAARNPRRGKTRATSRAAYTPPPPHAASPSPSTFDLHGAQFGQSHLPLYPGANTRGAQGNKELTSGSRTAPMEIIKHYPDSLDRPVSLTPMQSIPPPPCLKAKGNGAFFLTRKAESRHSNERKSATPNEGDLLPSPIDTPKGCQSIYNPVYRTSPACDTKGSHSSTPADTSSGFLLGPDGTIDFTAENSRDGTDSRLSRRFSPKRESRHGRLSGSTPSRGEARSTSSHRSLALEKTEGKPT